METARKGYVNRTRKGCTEGQARVYCEQVNAGAKPMADLMCRSEDLDTVREEVERTGLILSVNKSDPEWIGCSIYKDSIYKVLEDIICLYRKGHPPDPNSPLANMFFCWISGKMLGYSDSEILNHLRTCFDLDSIKLLLDQFP